MARIDAALAAHEGPVILDSFCGTGLSTAMLARRHPGSLVLGVDRSAHRLNKAESTPDNALLLRAHCEAVWRHLVERRQTLAQHYLLYPNPWPKAAQLRHRVHGHPAFALIPKLGGELELRSNWQVYVEEFGIALHLLGIPSRIAVVAAGAEPSTRFEHKYAASGHMLWQLRARLRDDYAEGSARKNDACA